MSPPERATELRKRATLRRWAAWGAKYGPRWFVRGAPVVIGAFFAVFSADARRNVVLNLRRIHGERPLFREALDVLSTFVHFAHSLTRSLAPDRQLLRAREFRGRGRHHVAPILAEGRGLLIVTAHVGPWDSAAMGLGLRVPVLMLMSPEEDQQAGEFQDQVREAAQVGVLRVGRTELDALPILDHLDRGGVVVAQIDRVPDNRPSLVVDLFGKPFPMPQGLFRLASIARVPLAPVFCARLPRGRALIEVGPPLFVPERTRGAALIPYARQIAARLEAHLCAFPTQWFHFSAAGDGEGASPGTATSETGAPPHHLAEGAP